MVLEVKVLPENGRTGPKDILMMVMDPVRLYPFSEVAQSYNYWSRVQSPLFSFFRSMNVFPHCQNGPSTCLTKE